MDPISTNETGIIISHAWKVRQGQKKRLTRLPSFSKRRLLKLEVIKDKSARSPQRNLKSLRTLEITDDEYLIRLCSFSPIEKVPDYFNEEITGDESLIHVTDTNNDKVKMWKKEQTWDYRRLLFLGQKSKVCTISMTYRGSTNKKFDISFESEEEARDFQRVFLDIKELRDKFVRRKFAASRIHTTFSESFEYEDSEFLELTDPETEKKLKIPKVKYLVEIVSAANLSSNGASHKPNPYVICKVGHTEVHRTLIISKSTYPIWTISTKSFFLFEIKAEYIRDGENNLFFEVNDHFDGTKSDKNIGFASVPFQHVMNGNNERKIYDLDTVNSEHEIKTKGKIIISIRKATKEDIEFTEALNSSDVSARSYVLEKYKEKNDVEYLNSYVGPRVEGKISLNKITKVNQLKRSNKDGKYYIKPYPDPENSHIRYIESDMVQQTTLQPSRQWIELGSGKLGYIFLEVIGCHDLPNMDNAPLDKTDAFVTAVYEDSAISTDVVPNCLSPRFFPWTRRAFKFCMNSINSHLYIAVHDYDSGSAHEPIGRVTVRIGDFCPNTQYLLHYNLHKTARFSRSPEKTYGRIQIRLSYEIGQKNNIVKNSMRVNRRFYLNCFEKDNLRITEFAMQGTPSVSHTSIGQIKFYAQEILLIFQAIYYVFINVAYVILWRGHYVARIGKGRNIFLPLHSIYLFSSALLVVEHPRTIPSVILFSIAWVMLWMLHSRRLYSSKWEQPPSYYELLTFAASGNYPSKTIDPNDLKQEEESETSKYNREYWETNQKMKNESFQRFISFLQDYFRLGINVDSFPQNKMQDFIMKKAFRPFQAFFGQICELRRIIAHFVSWRFPLHAFLLTTTCMILSVMFLFVPWSLLYKWIGRFVVCVFLGPHMKLLDFYYFQTEKFSRDKKEIQEYFFKKREHKAKLLGMIKFLFGSYSTWLSNPKNEYYIDTPIAEYSCAKPIPANESREIKTSIMGTTTVGIDITPKLS